jgi:drug/metabolite transporter (DMT)-like permease
MVGVGAAIVAGGLVSRGTDEPPTAMDGRSGDEGGSGHDAHQRTRDSFALAVAAGIGFGTSFICYVATSEDSGLWPVLTARAAAVVGVGVVVALARPSLAVPRTPGLHAVVAGVLDVTAATLLLIAAREGLAATVAPVAALGPGFTVGHARWYLRERLSRPQLAGLALALAGLALIASG